MYGKVDYSNAKVQQDMEDLTSAIEDLPVVGKRIFTDSWLREFLTFADDTENTLSLNISTEVTFADALFNVSCLFSHPHV